MSGLRSCRVLRELELYENCVCCIEGLDGLVKLATLDLSYNRIQRMEGLGAAGLPSLRELYLANNRISAIEGLEGLDRLEVLELGSNQLRRIANLRHLGALRELHLGRNDIDLIGEGLAGLASLRTLGLASNRLRSLQGVEAAVGLRELYADHNIIDDTAPILGLSQLHTVELSANRLRSIQVAPLSLLEELWLSDNPIDDAAALADVAVLPRLKTLYLSGCPFALTADYRASVLGLAPSTLVQLDADSLR